jgi:protease-4
MSEEKAKPNPIVRFFKFIFKFIYGYFAFIGFFITLSIFSTIFFLAKSERRMSDGEQISLPESISLNMELSGEILQQEPDEFEAVFFRLMGQKQGIYLPNLRAALRRAQTDGRVKRLDIEIGSLKASMAEYEELRRLLKEFSDSGKEIQVVLNEPSDWNYFVATAGKRIIVNPTSSIELFGPTFHLIYFGEALKKLGVDIEVIRSGKYKSAFEPFVQNAPSEPTLEQYRSMEQSLRDVLVAKIAESRGKNIAEVSGWLKQSLFTADEAIKAGIIDGVGYFNEGVQTPEAKKELVSVGDYGDAVEGDENPLVTSDKSSGIALISAFGEISMTAGNSSGDGISPDQIREEIRWAKDNTDSKAVVIRISSPGGSAVASDMIWREIRELVAVKPVVVSMGAVAASGGYYIAAPATKILAETTTITGSIGVIGMLPNFSPFEEKYGVSFHVVSESDRQNIFNMGVRSTDQDKLMIQASIDQVYKVFISKVAEGRKMDVATVDQLGQGRVYTGAQALNLKLVDQIGGLQDAFKEAKILGGLDPEKLYSVHTYTGDGFDIRKCLSSTTEMMRCLQKVSIKVPAIVQMFPLANDPMQETMAGVKRWIGMMQKERTLALWPGYLAITN